MAIWFGTFGDDKYFHEDDGDHDEFLFASALGGHDTVTGGNASDTVFGGDGNDNLVGNSANLYETGDGDYLGGDAGNDFIFGLGGKDSLFGGADNDFVDGGGDNDQVNGDGGNDTIRADWGNDQVNGGDGHDDMSGGDGDDTVTAGAGQDILRGDSGTDILTADGSFADGRDTFFGGPGHDVFRAENSNIAIGDSEGYDRLEIGVSFSLMSFPFIEDLTLTGGNAINGAGNDAPFNALRGNDNANVLYGMGGDDALYGFGGNDTLVGGASDNQVGGVDNLYGGTGNDLMYARDAGDFAFELSNEGVDLVMSTVDYSLADKGAIENLTLEGTARVGIGNGLRNTITGNAVNNALDGGTGADVLAGGLGHDTYVLGDVASVGFFLFEDYDTVQEAANAGSDTVLVGREAGRFGPITYYQLGDNIENGTVTGTEGFDLYGNILDNSLLGNDAANRLIGGDGRDILRGRAGFDTLIGEFGNDSYVLRDVTGGQYDAIQEAENWGVDTVYVTRQTGGPSAYGLGVNLDHGAIEGTLAFDLHGNVLANRLTGNSAVNRLIGHAGNDALDGGLSNDVLTGGAGRDSFFFSSDLSPVQNVDVIKDFTLGEDIFRLDQSEFKSLATGRLAASAFRIGTEAGDDNDRIIYNQENGQLFYDPDGWAEEFNAVRFANVSPGLALTSDDFFVIA